MGNRPIERIRAAVLVGVAVAAAVLVPVLTGTPPEVAISDQPHTHQEQAWPSQGEQAIVAKVPSTQQAEIKVPANMPGAPAATGAPSDASTSEFRTTEDTRLVFAVLILILASTAAAGGLVRRPAQS